MFFLLYKHTDDGILMIFGRFPTSFRRFFKIVLKARRTFPNIFQEFPKMSEYFRRLLKTFEEDPKMFRWYTTTGTLIDKLDISEIIDIFTSEDIISSHVRISYRFYQFVTTRYTTDFYIIMCVFLWQLTWYFIAVYLSNRPQVSMVYITIIPWTRVGYEVIK